MVQTECPRHGSPRAPFDLVAAIVGQSITYIVVVKRLFVRKEVRS